MLKGEFIEALEATQFPGLIFLLAPSCENDFWTTMDAAHEICAWSSMREALAYIELGGGLIHVTNASYYIA